MDPLDRALLQDQLFKEDKYFKDRQAFSLNKQHVEVGKKTYEDYLRPRTYEGGQLEAP